jgi:hypothetical protein
MKTTIELPDTLFRRAKILAAQRDATLRDLVIEGLRHVTGTGIHSAPEFLNREEAAVATLGSHGLPVLKRNPASTNKVSSEFIDRLRGELGT